MTQLEGLRNFSVNIKPAMLKIQDRKKLIDSELQGILQYYLETVNYLSKQAS